MLDKIYRFITENDMVKKGETVVCGLSGGADSVCLLLALSQLSERLGIKVEALHVNHCLRGEESDRDEKFCCDLCERNSITFKAVSCNVREYANENSLSDEEAARKLRYGLFAENSKGKLLATAHNANDNLETVILNLARGTALKGIAGIPPVRDNIIRPLLPVTRQEIESFLSDMGQAYVTDSTNLSDDYTRNKIRHRIIPLLQELNSSVIETSVGSIAGLRSENSLIERLTDEAEGLHRNGDQLTELSGYDPVIRRRCIARLLSDNRLPYSRRRLEEIDDILMNGGKINISGDKYLVSDKKTLSLVIISSQQDTTELSVEMKPGINSIFPDRYIECEIINCDNFRKIHSVHKKLTFYLLDYDKIKGRAVIRNRRFGDRIQLCGRDFTSSVKKLINETVPQDKRGTMHFIEDEAGTIFAEHIGIAGRVAPGSDTKRLLKITVYSNHQDWSELIDT